jgi:galactosyl transferase GMA12/MNN10 family
VSAPKNASPSDIALVSFNQIPPDNPSYKYERLGQMALANQRQYAARHGYAFYAEAPAHTSSPPCWEKIPAILSALRRHRWVLWADSDALVASPQCGLEDFCDPTYDLVVQCPRSYFDRISLNADAGLAAMPVNSGVFMVQATTWVHHFLQATYAMKPKPGPARFWNGIGEQEAMINVLRGQPHDIKRIRYVDALQCHPALHFKGNRFVHFYGNLARHMVPLEEAETVLQRWESAIACGAELPADMARFHWCCIQNKSPDAAVDRGGPERFLYRPQDIQFSP